MKIFPGEVNKTVKALASGNIILYPTDTIWGIGCDALDESAIDKIYKIKQREDYKTMLVLVNGMEMLGNYVKKIPSLVNHLIDKFPGPLTIIYPGAKNLPENIVAADGTIGIRITSDVFCKEIIAGLNRPIVSSSANISQFPSPRNFREISVQVKQEVDHIVNHRQEERENPPPSRIVKIENDKEYTILR